MKKLAVTIIALLIVFSLAACNRPAAPASSPPVAPVSVVLPTGPLPDAQYTKAMIAPQRYYGDKTTALIPSDRYGPIVPYLGGVEQSPYGWLPQNLYGFCDLDGRIVCDPVYDQVAVVSRGGDSLYVLTAYEPAEDRDNGYRNVTTICPTDGSWTAAYGDVMYSTWTYWTNSLKLDYITASMDGKWGVLDHDGSILLPFGYTEPVCFSEGFAAVLSDDGKSMWYIDITGKMVFGPYEMPPPDSTDADPRILLHRFLFFAEDTRLFVKTDCWALLIGRVRSSLRRRKIVLIIIWKNA